MRVVGERAAEGWMSIQFGGGGQQSLGPRAQQLIGVDAPLTWPERRQSA